MVPFINAFIQRVIDMSYNRAIWKKKKASKQNTKQPEQLHFSKTLNYSLEKSQVYITNIFLTHCTTSLGLFVWTK